MKKLLILAIVMCACNPDFRRPATITSVMSTSAGGCYYHIKGDDGSFYAPCTFHVGDTVVIRKK